MVSPKSVATMSECVRGIVEAFQEHHSDRICTSNARELLNQEHGLNYVYTDSLGFVEGVSVLWDNNKVFMYSFHSEPYHVNFIVKAITSTYQVL